MKLLYATSLTFPSGLANRMQIMAMAKEFSKQMENNFWFGVSKMDTKPEGMQVVPFGIMKSYVLSWKYLKYLQKNTISHVYCREPRLLFFLQCYNFLFFRLPLVFIYEIHATPHGGVINILFEKILVRTTTVLIFITTHLKKIYQKQYGVKNKRVIIASDAVDLKLFDISMSKSDARKTLKLPEDKFIVAYCGRFKTLEMEKGISTVLEAMKLVEDDDVLFVAMGGKPRHVAEYKNIAKKIGLGNEVRIDGHATQEIVAMYQKAADVVVMPFPWTEHYAYAMSPLKMFEYMASQRPILSTDLPSVREVLNEKNAIFIPPADPKQMAEAIEYLKSAPIIAEEVAQQAYTDVKEKYTWEKRVTNILATLKDFLE
jgi:glycosyltransferase involved in cell wall biosynthesis